MDPGVHLVRIRALGLHAHHHDKQIAGRGLAGNRETRGKRLSAGGNRRLLGQIERPFAYKIASAAELAPSHGVFLAPGQHKSIARTQEDRVPGERQGRVARKWSLLADLGAERLVGSAAGPRQPSQHGD